MKDASHSSTFGRTVRACITGALFSALATTSAKAIASPEYPAALAKAANTPCVPQCTVCHTTNPGMSGTAQQPFALAMRHEGLLPGNEALVGMAYEKLKTDPAPPDLHPTLAEMVQSLDAGLDPNYDLSQHQLLCGPTYGCGAHIAKAPPRRFDAFAWALGVVALGATVRVVRRKR